MARHSSVLLTLAAGVGSYVHGMGGVRAAGARPGCRPPAAQLSRSSPPNPRQPLSLHDQCSMTLDEALFRMDILRRLVSGLNLALPMHATNQGT